jgi:hypothetical protein
MQVQPGEPVSVQLGPFAVAPALQEVECRLAPEPGAFIRIRPAAQCELVRVVVAIDSAQEGMLERGLAIPSAFTAEWEYYRITRQPPDDLARIQILAVGSRGITLARCTIEQITAGLRIEVEAGREIRARWEPVPCDQQPQTARVTLTGACTPFPNLAAVSS